jgi:hypothetical protein
MQGTVYDTISGSPVPYVIVKVAGVGTTTLTDREGRFRIMVPTDSAQLEFRRLGYYMRAVTVVAIGPAIDGDVFLRPIPVELEEIVVAGEAEDPAVRIMREAIARKKDLLSRIHDYRYDAYIKFLIRDLAKHEDSTEAVVLITETRTAAYWEQPDRYQEAIVARRQSSNLDAENNLVTVGQIVNFNRNRIDLQKYAVVSPTADDALDHYDYHLIDTLEVGSRLVFRLAVEPKSGAKPLFVGMIDVADSTYDVLGIDVGANDAIRFDFFKNLRYRQRMRDFGDDNWMPDEIRFTGELHLGIPIPGFPEHLSFEHVASLSDFRFDEGSPPSTLGEFLIVVGDGADDLDSAAWNERRTIPLRDVEQRAWARIDSLENQPASFGDRVLGGLFQGILLTTDRDFFHFNRVESTYLGARIALRDLSPNLNLQAKGGYSFGRDEAQYALSAFVRLSERQRVWVGGSYLDEIANRPELVSRGYNPTYLALLAKLDPFDYYHQRGFRLSASTKLVDFTRLQLWYSDLDQSSIDKVTDYSLLNVDRVQPENPPIADGRLRSLTVALSFDSRPLLKRKGRDYYLSTLTYTQLTGGVEIAAPEFINTDFDFTRYFLRFQRRQRTFNLGLTTMEGYVGFATGTLPPQRYYTVDFGKGAFFEEGGFSTMRESNFAGNRVAMLVVSHNFDQLLFRKSGLPLVKRIPFTLAVHGGVFLTDFIDHTPILPEEPVLTASTPYIELGFGFGNLTPWFTPINLGVYFSWQVSSYDTDVFSSRRPGAHPSVPRPAELAHIAADEVGLS